MKKHITAIWLVLVIFVLPLFPVAGAEQSHQKPEKMFVLPASLIEIEEEAFYETAAEKVVFPEGFLYVGDVAFDGARRLKDVYIPETTEFIADSAFSVKPRLTIHGIEGSYAEDWAQEHHVPFVVEDIWKSIIPNEQSINRHDGVVSRYSAAINPEKVIVVHERSEDEGKSKRPQDRPELNPIDYRFP